MNLYEFEGKELFAAFGIPVPRGSVVREPEEARAAFNTIGGRVVVKAQALSGKRGKAGAIRFCESKEAAERAARELLVMRLGGQPVIAVRVEEALEIAREHYLSITYDTMAKQPVLIYSASGGMDIEEVAESEIVRVPLDIRERSVPAGLLPRQVHVIAQALWQCFLETDARQVEVNPLAELADGRLVAADAKIALDDDAFFRHKEWEDYEERSLMGRELTERETAVKAIDEGEGYYRGTAGKYIEMDGDIAVLFSGGGASIANMDALIQHGLKPANYTEYSGNPPREKVAALARIVLSKPGLRGLWIAGGVANFTNVAETFQGIIDALDEVKPAYPIVVRRAGPFEQEGMELMRACAARNSLRMTLFGKEVPMGETAAELAKQVNR